MSRTQLMSCGSGVSVTGDGLTSPAAMEADAVEAMDGDAFGMGVGVGGCAR